MSYSNISAYNNAVATTATTNQLILLYDATITNLQQAKKAIEEKNIETRFNKVQRAYQIMTSLRDCLDFERGGEVAVVLRDWYTGCAMRIISINRDNSTDMCELCIKTIREMRNAWAEAIEIAAAEKAGGENKTATQPAANASTNKPSLFSNSSSLASAHSAQALSGFENALASLSVSV